MHSLDFMPKKILSALAPLWQFSRCGNQHLSDSFDVSWRITQTYKQIFRSLKNYVFHVSNWSKTAIKILGFEIFDLLYRSACDIRISIAKPRCNVIGFFVHRFVIIWKQRFYFFFRLSQTKPVFVYRLLAAGTMEEKIYNRQVTYVSKSYFVLIVCLVVPVVVKICSTNLHCKMVSCFVWGSQTGSICCEQAWASSPDECTSLT